MKGVWGKKETISTKIDDSGNGYESRNNKRQTKGFSNQLNVRVTGPGAVWR